MAAGGGQWSRQGERADVAVDVDQVFPAYWFRKHEWLRWNPEQATGVVGEDGAFFALGDTRGEDGVARVLDRPLRGARPEQQALGTDGRDHALDGAEMGETTGLQVEVR